MLSYFDLLNITILSLAEYCHTLTCWILSYSGQLNVIKLLAQLDIPVQCYAFLRRYRLLRDGMYRQTDSEGRRPTAAVTVRRARGLNRYWVRRRRTGCLLLHQKQEHLPQARRPFPVQRYLYKDAFPQQVYFTNICHLDTASWEQCTFVKFGHCSLSHRLSLNATQVKSIALFIDILTATWWWLGTACLHLTDRQTCSWTRYFEWQRIRTWFRRRGKHVRSVAD